MIFPLLCPCINYRAIKYAPVSIEFGKESLTVPQTLLIQGDNLCPCILYRGISDTGASYCTNCALCIAPSSACKDTPANTDKFPWKYNLLFLLFLDTFCIQGILSFLLFLDTFRIQKCQKTEETTKSLEKNHYFQGILSFYCF